MKSVASIVWSNATGFAAEPTTKQKPLLVAVAAEPLQPKPRAFGNLLNPCLRCSFFPLCSITAASLVSFRRLGQVK